MFLSQLLQSAARAPLAPAVRESLYPLLTSNIKGFRFSFRINVKVMGQVHRRIDYPVVPGLRRVGGPLIGNYVDALSFAALIAPAMQGKHNEMKLAFAGLGPPHPMDGGLVV